MFPLAVLDSREFDWDISYLQVSLARCLVSRCLVVEAAHRLELWPDDHFADPWARAGCRRHCVSGWLDCGLKDREDDYSGPGEEYGHPLDHVNVS